MQREAHKVQPAPAAEPRHRLGCAGRLLSAPQLRAHDNRGWARGSPLSLRLLALSDTLDALLERDISCYRLSDTLLGQQLPGLEVVAHQLEQCAAELAVIGARVRAARLRLSMHLRAQAGLTTPDEQAAARALEQIEVQARLFEALGLGREAALVLHPGGRYGAPHRALERLLRRLELLTPHARARLAVEHDRCFALNDLLHLHARSGLPVVFDHLHHLFYNPQRLDEREALDYALQTWPPDVRPKVHFSSPRTELRIVEQQQGGRRARRRLEAPDSYEHSDYANPFEFCRLLRLAQGLRAFDIMLESKAGDLALLRLRDDLARFAPELAGLVR